ncbi:MAG: hypothetical protein ABL867_01520 [Rickettsiales bacterium]
MVKANWGEVPIKIKLDSSTAVREADGIYNQEHSARANREATARIEFQLAKSEPDRNKDLSASIPPQVASRKRDNGIFIG